MSNVSFHLKVFIEKQGDRPGVADTIILITDGVPTLEENGLRGEVCYQLSIE